MEKEFLEDGGEYKTCLASSLFEIKGNPQLDKDSFVFGEQSIYPYFTRTVFNNGILGYVDYLDDEHLIKGNSLAVGMMGMRFFYMKHDFYAGQFTKTAFPRFDGFNEHVALWFISWFNKSSPYYLGLLVRDFEDAFNNTELVVPYKNNKVAVDYIEKRLRELKEERLRELEAYLKSTGFEDCTLTPSELKALHNFTQRQKRMRKFRIVEEFTVANSHNILKSDVVFGSGKTPYVTASEGNNSIVSYITYEPEMVETGNSIMIGGKTLVVTYQPKDFFSNDSHNLVLTINHTEGRSETAQLFMVAALYKSLSPKYSWGDSISKAKIQSDEVFLPIKTDGSIDFEFMQNYISAIKKQCIVSLKREIDKEHVVYGQTIQGQSKSNSNIDRMTYMTASEPQVSIAAEDIFIDGSIPVDLPNTIRKDLIDENLDLVLMYAIGDSSRKQTEASGKIALGIKEDFLEGEQKAAYNSVKYLLFHYWSDPKVFHLTKDPLLVDKEAIPSNYLLRQENGAAKFLLLDYNSNNPILLENINILKTQRRGSVRYLPFVTTLESIKE